MNKKILFGEGVELRCRFKAGEVNLVMKIEVWSVVEVYAFTFGGDDGN